MSEYINNEEQPEHITCEQAVTQLEARITTWLTEDLRSPDEKIRYAYHVTRWMYDIFGPEAVTYRVEDIPGSSMPSSLQPLITKSYKEEDFLTDENRIRIDSAVEYEYRESFIPEWDKMSEEIVAYDRILSKVANDPEILSKIRLPEYVLIDRMHIRFEPAFYYRWGLDFYISSHDVAAYPFGETGHTESPTSYVIGALNRPQILASTVLEAALLCGKYARVHQNVPVSIDVLDLFDRRIAGIEPVQIGASDRDTLKPQPGDSMKVFLISELQKMGKLPYKEQR